jgi:hypothetical protein
MKQLKQKTMRTKSVVLTVLAIFIAAAVSATKPPVMNVITVQKEKALVAIESSVPFEFELNVQNKKGETLYSRKSENPVHNYSTVLSFSMLECGSYHVNLTFGNCTIHREIILSNNGRIKVGEEIKTYSPFYQFEDNLLKISYLNNQLHDINLSIYQNGEHIAAKKLGKDMCIQKVFDFSKLDDGEFLVVLNDRHHKYPYYFHK